MKVGNQTIKVTHNSEQEHGYTLQQETVGWNRSSVVGIATTLRAGWFGVRIPVRTRAFVSSEKSRTALGPTQLPVNGYQEPLLGGTAVGGGGS